MRRNGCITPPCGSYGKGIVSVKHVDSLARIAVGDRNILGAVGQDLVGIKPGLHAHGKHNVRRQMQHGNLARIGILQIKISGSCIADLALIDKAAKAVFGALIAHAQQLGAGSDGKQNLGIGGDLGLGTQLQPRLGIVHLHSFKDLVKALGIGLARNTSVTRDHARIENAPVGQRDDQLSQRIDVHAAHTRAVLSVSTAHGKR